MDESVKIKEPEGCCWKCRTTTVEVNATDSIYRLKCNNCYKYWKEKWRHEWISRREYELAGCQYCWDAYTFQKKSKVHKCSVCVVYQCRRCAYQLNSYKSLNVHLKVAHCRKEDILKSSRKHFDCKICKKTFITSGERTVHIRTHTGEKPFQCTVCTKSFSQSGALTVHLRTHTGIKTFQCTICEKAFTNSGDLTVHLRTHTGEKPFKCHICTKAFTQSGHLKVHLRTHTGVKPFQCKICPKAYTNSGDLTVHLRTHTGEKPFVCNFCTRAFNTSGHLRVHLRRHTREMPFQSLW